MIEANHCPIRGAGMACITRLSRRDVICAHPGTDGSVMTGCTGIGGLRVVNGHDGWCPSGLAMAGFTDLGC